MRMLFLASNTMQGAKSGQTNHLTTVLMASNWHPLRPEPPSYFPDSIWLYAGPEVYFHGGGGTSIGDLTYIVRKGHYQARRLLLLSAPYVTPSKRAPAAATHLTSIALNAGVSACSDGKSRDITRR